MRVFVGIALILSVLLCVRTRGEPMYDKQRSIHRYEIVDNARTHDSLPTNLFGFGLVI
jgi:hypothetical protein